MGLGGARLLPRDSGPALCPCDGRDQEGRLGDLTVGRCPPEESPADARSVSTALHRGAVEDRRTQLADQGPGTPGMAVPGAGGAGTVWTEQRSCGTGLLLARS